MTSSSKPPERYTERPTSFRWNSFHISDLLYGFMGHLGVNEVTRKKRVLQPLPYKARSLDDDWVNKQATPLYSWTCFTTWKGQHLESTERWF